MLREITVTHSYGLCAPYCWITRAWVEVLWMARLFIVMVSRGHNCSCGLLCFLSGAGRCWKRSRSLCPCWWGMKRGSTVSRAHVASLSSSVSMFVWVIFLSFIYLWIFPLFLVTRTELYFNPKSYLKQFADLAPGASLHMLTWQLQSYFAFPSLGFFFICNTELIIPPLQVICWSYKT